MHCGMARAQATTGGFACAGRLHGGGEPQLTQRREGRPLGDDELAVRVRDVALDVAAVDEVGEDALDLVDLHLGVRRLEASLEALDVELGRLVGVEQRDAAEEVAVHDQLGALDEQVRAVPDEALLVRRELLLERVEVASVHGAAERDEVVEPVLAQQRLGREHAEREPHGHEVAEHKPLVASRSARAALEGPGELPLRGAKVGVEQRQPAREVPGQPAKEGRGRGGALAGPAGSKEVAASRPVARCLGSVPAGNVSAVSRSVSEGAGARLYVTTSAFAKCRPSTVCPSSAFGKAGPSTARIRFWQSRKLLIAK
mmetsp:Transcript_23237/g.77122  ORF Transcript_23237/g.77122 Transcript_23237/m.77122 type:complete len:314 (-) Transcript_23237:569-1510(-)